MTIDLNGRVDEHVTPHFTWGELTHTAQTQLQQQNRRVPRELIPSARALCETVLEPIRAHFGPVIVHSAYRCAAVNGSTPGASTTSQHLLFQAADIHARDASLQDVFEWVRTESQMPYGQLLLESRAPGPPRWLHVSLGEPFRPFARCREAGTKLGTARVTWIR